MELTELIPIVEKYAPVLASALGGPFAGTVLSILVALYKGSSKSDLLGLATNISADPFRLKEIEFQHQEQIGEQLVSLLEIVENRASNRVLWVSTIVFGMAFITYLVLELFLSNK
jgi:hypothetical protein